MQRHLLAACAATLLASATASFAQDFVTGTHADVNIPVTRATMGASGATKMVGGAPMYPGKDIIDNAMHSRDHTTLVAAVKAAGLVDTLKGSGPFTVFAPTNTAFSMLPAGTVDMLLKAENKAMLTQVLTYHVVPGRIDAAVLADQIRAGGGHAMLKTASGGMLTAAMRGKDVVIWDAKGNAAVVTTADVYQSNGVIHVVDKVLMPGG
ncbi:MAG TPA: fasciclin domain-containing protein [Ramlibacter sp.]|uniref:fasciclin domain-containing protein n=1 Tax=Ramlibacter sp. TaxID=1917967 RepID=UPI002ED5A582